MHSERTPRRRHGVELKAQVLVECEGPGASIAAVAQDLLRIPDCDGFRLSWGIVNCGVTKLVRGREGVRLSTLNGHAHFEGEHAGLVTYR